MIASAARLTSRAHYGAMKGAPRKETFGKRLFACGREALHGHVVDIAVYDFLCSDAKSCAGCARYCRSLFLTFWRKAICWHAGDMAIYRFLHSSAKSCTGMRAIWQFIVSCVQAQSHALPCPQLHNRIYSTQQFSFCAESPRANMSLYA